jgi:hypothetical protein
MTTPGGATLDGANPYIVRRGHSAYSVMGVRPQPCVKGEACNVSVVVGNSGDLTSVCNVSVGYTAWGVSFGGWRHLGSGVVSVASGTVSPPNGTRLVVEYVPRISGQTCLRATLVALQGGNTDLTVSRALTLWAMSCL